jgi:hypothetical protein
MQEWQSQCRTPSYSWTPILCPSDFPFVPWPCPAEKPVQTKNFVKRLIAFNSKAYGPAFPSGVAGPALILPAAVMMAIRSNPRSKALPAEKTFFPGTFARRVDDFLTHNEGCLRVGAERPLGRARALPPRKSPWPLPRSTRHPGS